MSSFTFADNKLGGRLTACCDAIAASHLNRAAGILAELADELNVEATNAGLLAEDDVLVLDQPVTVPEQQAPQLSVSQAPVDMQSCTRNVHVFGPADPVSGWCKCTVCGVVSVVGQNTGPYDMGARQ